MSFESRKVRAILFLVSTKKKNGFVVVFISLLVAGLNVTMGIYQLLGWGFKKVEVTSATRRVLVEYLFSDDRVLEEERFERLYCEAMLLLDQVFFCYYCCQIFIFFL
jgi:hypothetical protein